MSTLSMRHIYFINSLSATSSKVQKMWRNRSLRCWRKRIPNKGQACHRCLQWTSPETSPEVTFIAFNDLIYNRSIPHLFDTLWGMASQWRRWSWQGSQMRKQVTPSWTFLKRCRSCSCFQKLSRNWNAHLCQFLEPLDRFCQRMDKG